MPRRRLGVALLVPPPVATEIDGLRRALGDGALGRIPAHMTLVPPVNVQDAAMTDAVAVLRDAARSTGPIDVRIGPAATFAPVTPVVYLTVGGDAEAVHVLRDLVFRPPLARSLTHPFVPHVTVADDLAPARIPSAVAALADFVVDVRIASVHLLEERRGHVWEPIAEAPFSRRRPSGPAVRNG